MVIHPEQFNGIAICAGNGGLELGLKLALDVRYKTVCYVEREAYNAATLVARMEDALLDNAPVWDDITTFDGKPWRGIVDIISAGFPCQPHSAAGKRKGMSDERWIWNDIIRAVSEILPGIVFLENVPDLAFSGLAAVLGTLSEAGYSSVWDTFSAEEAGASQIRERLFILSYRHGLFDRRKQTEREAWRNIISGSDGQNFSESYMAVAEHEFGKQQYERRLCTVVGTKRNVVFADGNGKQTREIGESIRESESSIAEMADSFSERYPHWRQSAFSRRTENQQTGNFVFPPFRNDDDGWGKYLAERPDAEPAILRSSDGLADRMDRIRTVGNGVVPLVVAYAFATLARTAFKLEM